MPKVRTHRVSATERFHTQARQKKLSPVAVILGVIGAGLLVAIGFIVFGGGERIDVIRDRIEILKKKADRQESAGKWTEAVGTYRQAVALAQPVEELRGEAAQLRATTRELESRVKQVAAATAEIDAYLQRSARATKDDADAFVEEGHALLRKYRGADLEGLVAVRKRIETLKALVPKRVPFEVKRREISLACETDNQARARYAEALGRWEEYRKSPESEGERGKVDKEVERLNNWAGVAANRILRAAKRKIEAGDKNAASDLIRDELPRFKGTTSQPLLERQLSNN